MIQPEPRLRRWLRLLGDLILAPVGLYGAFVARIYLPIPFTLDRLPMDRLELFAADWGLVLLSQPAVLYFFGLYDPPHPRHPGGLLRRLLPAVSLQGLLLGSFYFLTGRPFPRSVLVLFLVINGLLLFLWRFALRGPASRGIRQLAVVGSGPVARELAEAVAAHPEQGLAIAGWVSAPGDQEPPVGSAPSSPPDANGDPTGPPDAGDPANPLGPCLGTLESLPALVSSGRVDDVILATSTSLWQTRLLDRLAADVGPVRGNVLVVPGPFESLIGRMRYRWIRDIPLIEVVRDSEWRFFRPIKRALDLAVGLSLLLLTLPVMLVVAAAVKLTSPGPILYRQERIGREMKPFTLWKFRTMGADAEQGTGEVLAVPGDPRLTTIGATLRRLRLDELPQLFNVLQGTMSLVGPRPERPGFVARYLGEVPGYAERFFLTPGLTGLAQVNGDYHSTPQNKLRYDLAYMSNWSLWLDLTILVWTVKIVLTSRGT